MDITDLVQSITNNVICHPYIGRLDTVQRSVYISTCESVSQGRMKTACQKHSYTKIQPDLRLGKH